jgi:hypothetical protein
MRTIFVMTALAGFAVVIAAHGALLAAPGQGQERPGIIGQSKVWIENRGAEEAVPVTLQNVVAPAPLAVQVSGTPIVAFAPTAVVQARVIRQSWEYRTISLTSGLDPAPALTAAGNEGWEIAGQLAPSPSGSLLVLKRPR